MDKNQQNVLMILLILGLLYCIYLTYFKVEGAGTTVEKMENQFRLQLPFREKKIDASYTSLTAPQKSDLSPANLMTGEVFRYISSSDVSYDVYGYLHLINGSVFDKKVDQKYKIYIGDSNGNFIVEEELKRDGDDVYKLKLKNLKLKNPHLHNNVILTFVDENKKESVVLHGKLVKQ